MNGGVMKTGVAGFLLIDAYRNGQLTACEVMQRVKDESLPELFAVLCSKLQAIASSPGSRTSSM